MADNPFHEFVARYGPDTPLFVREVVGEEPYEDQLDLLQAFDRGERRIAKRSGHGVGKSAAMSWIATKQIICRFPQKTIITSASAPQLWDALAAEVKSVIKRLPKSLQDLLEIQSEGIYLKSAPDDSFISFRVSKAETPEAMAGVHSPGWVLLICDEASGIPDPVFEAASGSMSGHNCTTILAGNPVRTAGLFYDAFHNLQDRWWTQHVSCVGHPNVSPDYVEDQKARYGEDTNAYRVRVLGDFPTSEDDVVIPFDLIEAALSRDVQPKQVRPIWGVDIAYTGGDRSALAKRKGNVLTEKVKTWKLPDTMQSAGVIHNEWKDTPLADRPEEILVDSIGYGAGVADRLRELGLPARGINVSETPPMKDRYPNLRAELWFAARAWFEARDCHICGDKELAKELGVVHVLPPTSNGKVAIEKKVDIKKTLKNKSPDVGDAFVLTFAGTAVSALYGSTNSTTWNQPLPFKLASIV